jgi:hypothetical protein
MASPKEPKSTSSDRLEAGMTKVAIVLLILLLVVVALPLGMGMAMGTCPNSDHSSCAAGVSMCLAIIGLLSFAVVPLLQTVRRDSRPALGLLLVGSIDRPPRLV